MNSRDEMIPAPVRRERHSLTICNSEWQLLCKIRYGIQQVTKETNARTMRKLLKGLIVTMDDAFDDWPEDPK